MDKLSEDLVEKLRADFPPESIQVRSDYKDAKTGKSKVLVGYMPQYVVERLNDVFGHFGWDFEIVEKGQEGTMVWVLGKLTIYNLTINKEPNVMNGTYVIREKLSFKEQFGMGEVKKDMSLGDAYKSATTDAIGKCASWFDVGHKAYKGLEKVPDNHPKKKETVEAENSNKRGDLLKDLLEECKNAKINKAAFSTLVKTVLKEEKSIDDIDEEEIQKLIDHIKKTGAPF